MLKALFKIGEQQFDWEDVALAAQLRGEWAELEMATRQGLAGIKRAAETNQWPAAEEVQAAANSFRYAHNLISAQETQDWLQHWGLTVDGWMDYFRRSLLREQWSSRLTEIGAAYPVRAEEVAGAIQCEALCSGQLADWAHQLAGRVALANQAKIEIGATGFDAYDREATALCIDSPFAQIKLEAIARIEAAYQILRHQIITPQARRAQIAHHHLDWIRFDCRYIWFPEEYLAREAALCLREDGLTLDEVARDSRFIVQHHNFYLDEIEPAGRNHFLAAQAGDWLGPLDLFAGFTLFGVLSKCLPSDDDLHVRQRAEEAIMRSACSREISRCVTWLAHF
jgi:hypothetical protein